MPQKQQLHALLQWTDSSIVHLVNLVDGKETIVAYPLQESIEEFSSNNAFVGADQFLICDNGNVYSINFDGKLEPVAHLAQFGGAEIRTYKKFPGMDVAMISFYDQVLFDERIVFFNTTTGAIIRELTGSMMSDANGFMFESAALRYGADTYVWQGKVVFAHANDVNVMKLCAYDPVTNITTLYDIPGYEGREGWNSFQAHFYNNKLFLVPTSTAGTVAVATLFEVDAAWTITPRFIDGFDGDPSVRIAKGVRGDAANIVPRSGNSGRYVQYAVHYNGNKTDLDVIMIDLSTMLGVFSTLDVPGTLPFDVAALGIADMRGFYSGKDDLFYSQVAYMRDNTNNASFYVKKIYVWDVFTGNVLREIPFTMEPAGKPAMDSAWAVTLPIYSVAGNIQVDGVGVAAKVKLIDIDSDRVINQTTSAGNGAYSFNCFTATQKTAIALHPTEDWHKTTDPLTPTPVME